MVLVTTLKPENYMSLKRKEAKMGAKGKTDKGKREIQKKNHHTLKEKRKQKKDKR